MRQENTSIDLGSWTEQKLNKLISASSLINDAGLRIASLSSNFLGTEYMESTLTGNRNVPEIFTVNLRGVDCFTFIDYIEAMRLADSYTEFLDMLKKIRYQSGTVSFKNRNHFFTDWSEHNKVFVKDVTEEISGDKVIHTEKMLNLNEDGSFLIDGINPEKRDIAYIPSDAIESQLINKLKTGDYVGIYSNSSGLDVSHVGIIIREDDAVYLRHASYLKNVGKVVDQVFHGYIKKRPGLIVLRPLN